LPNLDIATARVTVTEQAAPHFAVTLTPPASSVQAGTPFSVTVTAQDGNGNTITDYTGTIHFTSSDGHATLPANYTFTSADHGAHTFAKPGGTLRTPGSQTIMVNDTVATGVTGSTTVMVSTTSTVTHFSISAPSTSQAGSTFTVTVTALDVNNRPVADYTGMVFFTSSDGQATLPGRYNFTAVDRGVHTFAKPGVTLRTLGNQTITVSDSVATGVTGTATVNVTGGKLEKSLPPGAPGAAKMAPRWAADLDALLASLPAKDGAWGSVPGKRKRDG
jgi:hypothetical protein